MGWIGRARGRSAEQLKTKRAVVVGGGLGGIAAAAVLAERGVRVTLIEAEEQLGGRLRAWSDQLSDGTPFEMDRGFHAFFRHYKNVRALLRRIDPALSCLVPLHDYPILGQGLPPVTFSKLPKNPILALIQLVRDTPSLDLKTLAQIPTSVAFEMLRYDPTRTYARFDGILARDYLNALKFPADARTMLFEVFAHSFFNPEDAYSAAELLMMFHYYFIGNPEGLIFDVVDGSFGERLWTPFAQYLRGLGAELCMGERASHITRTGPETWRVHTDRQTYDADALVLATPVGALRNIVSASPTLDHGPWRRSVEAQQITNPFAVWRLWLDRPLNPERAPFVGTAGCPWLDNISIYDLFHAPSRTWAKHTGGTVVELHAYALPPSAADPTNEPNTRLQMYKTFCDFYPEAAAAQVVDERFMIRQDCPAFQPHSHTSRPTPETPWPTLTLAGDFTKLPFPSALMERATSSGFLAANHLLRRWLGPKTDTTQPVFVPPTHGMLSRLPLP